MKDEPESAEGVSVPTETYKLQPADVHDAQEEALKLLPKAFENLAKSETVRLGLDADEEQLFDTLLNTTKAYEAGELKLDDGDDSPPQELEIRVAGGWVRDKILGLQTHDVDIAVDKMMGVSFATLIQKYLLSLPENHPARCKTKYPKMGVIAANPAQSKHLETATMKVHNIDIDVCHLRAEEIYQEHSRIPTAIVGTPFQDAQRRDFTLNALFFNLKTMQVEDWTRRGMHDLRKRRLVTPLDPKTTFEDDPLRVLRAIRFAVRYQLELDEGLKEACMTPKIHKALQVKVSRERVGKELEGMLSGKGANPQLALSTIARLKLAGGVFMFPATGIASNNANNRAQISSHARGTILGHDYQGEHDELNHLRELGWEESQRLLKFLPQLYELNATLPVTHTKVDKRLLSLAVFLSPFRKLTYEESKPGNAAASIKEHSVVLYMFKEAIKFKNKDVQGMTSLMENVDLMAEFLSDLATQKREHTEGEEESLKMCRLEAGLVLRHTRELWVTTLLLACLVKMREQQLSTADDTSLLKSTNWLRLTAAAYRKILDLNLEECWKAKPLMNGRAVIEALKLPRGPQIAEYLEEQVKWMLLNPEGSKEECEKHLVSVKRQREVEEGESGASDSNGSNLGQPHRQHPRLE